MHWIELCTYIYNYANACVCVCMHVCVVILQVLLSDVHMGYSTVSSTVQSNSTTESDVSCMQGALSLLHHSLPTRDSNSASCWSSVSLLSFQLDAFIVINSLSRSSYYLLFLQWIILLLLCWNYTVCTYAYCSYATNFIPIAMYLLLNWYLNKKKTMHVVNNLVACLLHYFLH